MNIPNNVELFIPLGWGRVTVIDFADREGIVEHKWFAVRGRCNKRFRAARPTVTESGEVKMIYLHREIMKPGRGEEVDHIRGDPLDNRRHLLRLVTHAQNCQGFKTKKLNASSQFLGVAFNKGRGKWQAGIMANGKNKYLGLFYNEENAARARDKAAKELFGEFAQLNFPAQRGE